MDKKRLIEKLTSEEMRLGNVSLILENYNDIFSDFDPRSFSERAVSDDFLQECKRAVRDKPKDVGFELRLLIPKAERNLTDESRIKLRLKTHFQKHYKRKHDEILRMRLGGGLWFVIGIIFLLIATFIFDFKGFIYTLLIVLLEPAGWFTLWSGLDKIFLYSREEAPEVDFYRKMANCQISFISY